MSPKAKKGSQDSSKVLLNTFQICATILQDMNCMYLKKKKAQKKTVGTREHKIGT